MSQYYHGKRSRNIYDPSANSAGSDTPYKLSRSRIELFLNCPRCFYIDRRLGVDRPPGFPFNLNSAVDALLKKEFDIHRAKETTHPLIEQYGVDARPVAHEDLDIWRENFKGVQYHDEATNFIITGAIDDLWINSKGEYIVVDYKSTSKAEEITKLDKDWQIGYKRQMEIYQWLLRKNGYKVSDTGYFVYCNGDTDKEAFDGKLEFDITLIPYTGDDTWVEGAIQDAYNCLQGSEIPKSDPDCDYCQYYHARQLAINMQQNNVEYLYEDAVAFVHEKNKVSAAMLQKKFRIGYSQCALLLDLLEERGIIGLADGAKPRKVL